MYAAITPKQQQQALTWLLSAGHLPHCKGMSLEQVLELPLAARIVNMHATLIAKGQHPHLSPATAAHAGYPVAALPITRRVDQPRLARPPAHPHHPKHYFDARSAAAGDLIDQEDD